MNPPPQRGLIKNFPLYVRLRTAVACLFYILNSFYPIALALHKNCDLKVHGPFVSNRVVLRVSPEPSHLTAPPPQENGKRHCLRVLIVDDNKDGADSMGKLLQLYGCEVKMAYTGPTALDAAGLFLPELVLLDIGLPGLDGYKVCKLLREQAATAKAFIVAVTGFAQEKDREQALRDGFDRFLVKPVDPLHLKLLLTGLEPAQAK